MPTKRDSASGVVVDRLRFPRSQAEPLRRRRATHPSMTRAAAISCGAPARWRAARWRPVRR